MLAYLNGKLIPHAEATIPVWDFGFTMGVAVTEQLRTFGGKLFFLRQHLKRLEQGLAITGIDPGMSLSEIGEIAQQVVDINFRNLPAARELGVGICVTPGAQMNRVPAGTTAEQIPTVLIYARPLDVQSWAHEYESGIRLVTVETREVPNECVPRELKCRSRMHYYLAEQQATQKSPGSRALLLDLQGFVAEGTTASVVIVKDDCLIAPRPEKVLPGISWSFVESELADGLGLNVRRRDISLDELYGSDEVLWISTSPCVLPVCEVNGIAIGLPGHRPVFSRLIAAWSAKVGVDIRSEGIINRDA